MLPQRVAFPQRPRRTFNAAARAACKRAEMGKTGRAASARFNEIRRGRFRLGPDTARRTRHQAGES